MLEACWGSHTLAHCMLGLTAAMHAPAAYRRCIAHGRHASLPGSLVEQGNLERLASAGVGLLVQPYPPFIAHAPEV